MKVWVFSETVSVPFWMNWSKTLAKTVSMRFSIQRRNEKNENNEQVCVSRMWGLLHVLIGVWHHLCEKVNNKCWFVLVFLFRVKARLFILSLSADGISKWDSCFHYLCNFRCHISAMAASSMWTCRLGKSEVSSIEVLNFKNVLDSWKCMDDAKDERWTKEKPYESHAMFSETFICVYLFARTGVHSTSQQHI